MTPQRLTMNIANAASVSALLLRPENARACFVFAHGAGAGMSHPFMETVATGLCDRGIATLALSVSVYGKGQQAARCAGGRACGGAGRGQGSRAVLCRIAAGRGRKIVRRPHDLAGAGDRAAARRSRTGLSRLPVTPTGKPSDARAAHLSDIRIPMLFLQGTRDDFAEMTLLEPVVKGLGGLASLHLVQEGDHSFHVPARSGRNDREVMNEVLDALSAWIGGLAA